MFVCKISLSHKTGSLPDIKCRLDGDVMLLEIFQHGHCLIERVPRHWPRIGDEGIPDIASDEMGFDSPWVVICVVKKSPEEANLVLLLRPMESIFDDCTKIRVVDWEKTPAPETEMYTSAWVS